MKFIKFMYNIIIILYYSNIRGKNDVILVISII